MGNTCAGISQTSTKAHNLRVVVVGEKSAIEGGEEVQMVFVENETMQDGVLGLVEADVKYGKLD